MLAILKIESRLAAKAVALMTGIIFRDNGPLLFKELRMVQVVVERRAKDGVEREK